MTDTGKEENITKRIAVWSPHPHVFDDVLEVLRHEYDRMGYETVRLKSFGQLDWKSPEESQTVLIVVGEPFHETWDAVIATVGKTPKGNGRIVFWQWEQKGNTLLWRPVEWLRVARTGHLRQIWEFSGWLQRHALEICPQLETVTDYRVVPYLCAPIHPRFTPLDKTTCKKKWDVLFVGTWSERRQRVIDAIRAKGLKVEWITDGMWNPSDRRRNCSSAKIVLNISYYAPDNALEVHRINPLLAWNCCVVSEPSADSELNERYSQSFGVTFCPVERMPDICAELLASGRWEALGLKTGQLFRTILSTFPHLDGTNDEDDDDESKK